MIFPHIYRPALNNFKPSDVKNITVLRIHFQVSLTYTCVDLVSIVSFNNSQDPFLSPCWKTKISFIVEAISAVFIFQEELISWISASEMNWHALWENWSSLCPTAGKQIVQQSFLATFARVYRPFAPYKKHSFWRDNGVCSLYSIKVS